MIISEKRKIQGFSLIELLVTIAIIGLLSTLAIVSFNNARVSARDARRLADMRNIKFALDLYYDKNNRYPGAVSSYGESNIACGGWDISRIDEDTDGNAFIDPLVEQGFLTASTGDPSDASLTNCGGYKYYLYSVGSYGCDASKGDYYVLGVTNMETSTGNYPNSPGWSCSGRNWQGEFEWVTGKFTN